MLHSAAESVRSLDEDTRRGVLYTAVVANTLLCLLLVFTLRSDTSPTTHWLFPLVWITVGTWALLRASPPAADRRRRYLASTVAVGYFVLLCVVGGVFGPTGGVATGLTVQITDLPPGWNPAILYGGEVVRFAVIPFTTFGYAVLAYLVYVTALDASSIAAGGLLGVFSCVSCTLPVIASLLGGFIGGGLIGVASTQTYTIGTFVFVLTVGLLLYRPGGS